MMGNSNSRRARRREFQRLERWHTEYLRTVDVATVLEHYRRLSRQATQGDPAYRPAQAPPAVNPEAPPAVKDPQ